MPLNSAKLEEHQGKAMTDVAIDRGVKHIVFTATERGRELESDTNPTPVPHFVSKFNIEQDIMEKSKRSQQGTTWTMLRPVAFMENLSDDFLGRAFVAMWRLNGMCRKLQLVSTNDIGKVAAEAFLHAESSDYRNTTISLVGDEVSPSEAAHIFKEATGKEIPASYPFVGRVLKWILKEQLGIMFDLFKTSGFKADVEQVRRKYPFIQDLRSWLVLESTWRPVT